uniref:Uncharacterized protein n=1 Tax=Meloidogyne enterolobii TaxID=390850 RepID=A0A6V7Y8K9_MELEN|nr:unnamed protein product [Meloidogyne enterolobii]
MSSGPIRQMIGPIIKLLKNYINEAQNIITSPQDLLEENQLQRLRTLRKQLSCNTVRIEGLNREWLEFMGKIDPET